MRKAQEMKIPENICGSVVNLREMVDGDARVIWLPFDCAFVFAKRESDDIEQVNRRGRFFHELCE